MYINKKRRGQKGGKAVVEKKLRSQIVTVETQSLSDVGPN